MPGMACHCGPAPARNSVGGLVRCEMLPTESVREASDLVLTESVQGLPPPVELLITAWYATPPKRGGTPAPEREALVEEAWLEMQHPYPPGQA
jgi:hypothetical protein